MNVLSICIASFNKAELTESLVKSLLSIKSDEYNVVVVDNCSSDDTILRLQRINSPKLIIIENEQNIGGAANTINAVYSGDYMFSLYANDRDIILTEKIPDFIDFLKNHPEIKAGTANRHKDKSFGQFKIVDRREGLIDFSYRTSHPTGFFYNTKALANIPITEITENILKRIDFVPLAHEYLFARLACISPIAIYNEVIWKSTGNDSHQKYVSNYVNLEKNNINKKWFHPDDCLRRAQYNIKDAIDLAYKNRISLNESDIQKLLTNILRYETGIGVWRYRTIMRTPSLAYHYSVNTRSFSIMEALTTSYRFRQNFKKMISELNLINDKKLSKVLKTGKYVDWIQCKNSILIYLSKIKRKITK